MTVKHATQFVNGRRANGHEEQTVSLELIVVNEGVKQDEQGHGHTNLHSKHSTAAFET